MNLNRFLSLTFALCITSASVIAQCTPINCLATLPPYGGICDTMLATDTVGQFYSDFESFHTTTSCFDAGLINPANAGTGIRINVVDNFSFTGLPAGLTGSPNAPSYTSPANGCILFTGVPTEAGVFAVSINFLADVTAWPFGGGACSGFNIAQNNNAASYGLDLTIRPNASFTIPTTNFCSTDAAVSLTITGNTGGTFSGPGVTGSNFDPSAAGPGTHIITYTVSVQQGAAIAPATNSSTITVIVTAPTYPYYPDLDGDGYGDAAASSTLFCSPTAPINFSANNTDCDDLAPGINPGAVDIPGNGTDEDCNGSDAVLGVDADGDGFNNSVDCNDNNNMMYPGNPEVCDGLDNDCNSLIDDGLTTYTYYLDNDNDSYGDASNSIISCNISAPVNYVNNNTDCDDGNNLVYPGAAEICDGLDNDCNSNIDDGITIYTYYFDGDFDGFGLTSTFIDTCLASAPLGYSAASGDCNDANVNVNPAATEICDSLDNDCVNGIDDGIVFTYYYIDLDLDSYGNPNDSIIGCSLPSGYVTNNDDCDDNNLLIHPGMPDALGNGTDENCDGVDGILGGSNLESTLAITIHPNPANDFIYISSAEPKELNMHIYNLQGQTVLTQQVSVSTLYQLDITSLTPGVYVLEMVQTNTNIRGYQRLIVTR